MQLAFHTDYSLRVLLLLVANPDKRVTLNDISDIYGISKEHLRKVVHNLAKLDLITTYRGKSGGIELKQPPDTINIGELIEKVEPRKPVIDCNAQPCILANSCQLRSVLARAENAFFQELKQYTLSDLFKEKNPTNVLTLEP